MRILAAGKVKGRELLIRILSSSRDKSVKRIVIGKITDRDFLLSYLEQGPGYAVAPAVIKRLRKLELMKK
jgi:hypothetical protein